MKRKKPLTLFGGILLSAVLLVGSIGCPPPVLPVEPIRIGAIMPKTGGLEGWGEWMMAGAELRLEEAGWEVAGRPIEFLTEDGGSFDPIKALEMTKRLVLLDRVHVMHQSLVSGSFMAMKPFLEAEGILNFAPVDRGYITVWEPGEPRWHVSPGATMAKIGYAMGVYAFEELGIRTVTTLGDDYVTGYQVIGGFVDAFTRAGGTVVQQQWACGDTVDFAPNFVILEPADAFVVWFVGGGVNLVLHQFQEFGLFDKYQHVLVPAPYNLEGRLHELGDWAIGVYQAVRYSPAFPSPMNIEFVARIKARYGILPNVMHAGSYEAVSLILAVLEATGGDTTPEVMRDALIGLQIEGPSGVFGITEKGIAEVRDIHIQRIAKIDDVMQWEYVKHMPAVLHPGYFPKP